MPSAEYNNYVLREKVLTLVRFAEGRSFPNAAHGARTRVMAQRGLDFEPGEVSRDWRMTGDWVPRYADIIAERPMPKTRPRAAAMRPAPGALAGGQAAPACRGESPGRRWRRARATARRRPRR